MVSQVRTATVSWLTAICGSIPALKEAVHFVAGDGERMPTKLSMASNDGMSLSPPTTISFTSSKSNARAGTGSLPPSNGPTNATGALRPRTGTGLRRGFRSGRSMGITIAIENASSEETSFVMAHLPNRQPQSHATSGCSHRHSPYGRRGRRGVSVRGLGLAGPLPRAFRRGEAPGAAHLVPAPFPPHPVGASGAFDLQPAAAT